MTKYLINENIHGYEKITIENEKFCEESDNLIVVVIDKKCDNQVGCYYKQLEKALKNNNRIIMVGVEDENKSFRPLASMLVTFKNYDIYQVPDRESISAPYLLKIEDRNPDIAEVRTYIGGDITAYTDMNTILFGIESLVEEGNIEALKAFLEEHMNSIENMSTTLNIMKKTCDCFNSNELIDNINKYKDKEVKLNSIIEQKDKDIEEIKHDRDQNKVDADTLRRENEKLKNKNTDLKAQTESGVSVIKSYKEVNTQLITCKAKIIIYFKEVSYVQYTDTLITQLMEILSAQNLKHKTLIYDSNSEMYAKYKPLTIVTGQDYSAMKGNLISKTKAFVVAEPNPSILQDVLLSEQCFDVVIVYDRMRSLTDIVTGNNVTKFFVVNSSKDYDELKQTLKINDTSLVITHANSSIEKPKAGTRDKAKERKFLDIPTIEGYTSLTETARTSKYMKLATSFTKVPLLDTIFKKSRVDTLMKK